LRQYISDDLASSRSAHSRWGALYRSIRLTDLKRGDEKAVFKFGGLAIVVFGEPGKWTPEGDILANTAEQVETLIRPGEPVARQPVRAAA
jgi:hypothetical protein